MTEQWDWADRNLHTRRQPSPPRPLTLAEIEKMVPDEEGEMTEAMEMVVAAVEEILQQARADAERAAVARILAALQQIGDPPETIIKPIIKMARKKSNGAGRPSPARDLVEAELATGEKTVGEIFAAAGAGVSRDGVKQCLRRGLESGRYAHTADHKWALAGPAT